MKLTDTAVQTALWEEKGYRLPSFDLDALRERTKAAPTWVHFGAGNLFRAFPAALLQRLLDEGLTDRGVIAAEAFDYEIIDKIYRPCDNRSLLVTLRSDGAVEKRIITSVTESLKADPSFPEDWARLTEIFRAPSLQFVSFTVTEKGYAVSEEDTGRGLSPALILGKTALLLLARYRAGALPLTLQSMDNCSHNGDKIKNGVLRYAEAWVRAGLCDGGFLDYLSNGEKISFPWSMIDKITPRPDQAVRELLEADGFEDTETVLTGKNTYAAPFVNAEETEYLVMEDDYKNGRPPLERAGALYTDRETVEQAEKMKVCTCLNPLHTAMALFGCLLGYTRISEEMKDPDIRALVTRLGYEEALPVAANPGVLKPEAFLDTVLTRRLPNPFLPDAPQRIATDTSQKLSVRFGETIKAYRERGENPGRLTLVPLVLACYARYLAGIDDEGKAFSPSPDPLLAELQKTVAPLAHALAAGNPVSEADCLEPLYRRTDVFGVDLFAEENSSAVGLWDTIKGMAEELFAGPGAVRKTLHRYVTNQCETSRDVTGNLGTRESFGQKRL